MGHAIAHRGPDDEQFFDDGHLSLVFRRLSIVDLDGGRQPLFSDDGNQFVVVNGEIYNHEALRRRYAQQYRFKTRSDCEVALHLLAEQGVASLSQLNGMFAMAFWDRSKRQLLLARDRLGIKPLYFARLPDGLLFGSELKAMLAHPDCPRELEWSALHTPVAQMSSPVASYVRGLEHLPGGHWLRVTSERTESRSWWRIDDHLGTAALGHDANSYRKSYQELLERVAVEHLLGDVPVGLHLSGGLDSSLLAAIAAGTMHDLSCFSVIERNSFLSGDVASAQRTTERLKLPWYPVLFDQRTILDDIAFDLARLEQSVYMMDSPRFDPEWIFKEELHRAARRERPGLKVVLLGQGADEFAGGYSQRWDQPRRDWSDYVSSSVLPRLRSLEAEEAGAPERLSSIRRDMASPTGSSPYHRMMRRFSFQLQHFNLWHEDRTSMFQGLEARVPYLDHRLVELLASVPAELHAQLFWNKEIIRDAAKPHLPWFDPKHPKVPFFVSGDMRSIDILVHMMLQRTVVQFLDKYPDLTSFPFDPTTVRRMARRVLDRQGGFYRQGWLLMEVMVIAIFAEQCARPELQDFQVQRARREGPPLVFDVNWPGIKHAFETQPILPVSGWRDEDRLRVPEGAEILQPSAPEGQNRFLLACDAGIAAEIRVPAQMEWLPRFLRNLGRPETRDFTISDWEEEFDLLPAIFRAELDSLYAAGFVQRVRS